MAVRTLDDGIADDPTFGSLPAASILGNPTAAVGPVVATAGVTDGHVPTMQADGTWAWEAQSGGGGAPTDAEYIVGSANGTLSAERVVTDTAYITKDVATAGQLKLNIADGALSADAAGRAKMADLYLTLAKVGSAIFTADSTGRGKFNSNFVNTALINDLAVTFGKNFAYVGETSVGGSDISTMTVNLPSGQQGNDVHGYFMAGELYGDVAAFCDMLINGTDTIDLSRMIEVSSGSISGDLPFIHAATGDVGGWVAWVFTRTGRQRSVVVVNFCDVAGAMRIYLGTGKWTDTAANITSFVWDPASTNQIKAGGKINTWAF